MLEKPCFGYDCDGVQARSSISVLKQVERQSGIRIEEKDITGWDSVHQIILARTGSTQLAQDMNDYWFHADTLLESPPIRGTLLVMDLTRRLGADVITVTTRAPEFKDTTLKWYRRHLPWLDENLLYIRSERSCSGDEFKVTTCRSQRVTLFYEDAPHTIESLWRAGINLRVVTQPWNVQLLGLDTYRVHGWPHMLAINLAHIINFRRQSQL